MTRKLGHRDIVLICILAAALGATLLDLSGPGRIGGLILVVLAVLTAFASYVHQFRKDDQGVDDSHQLEDDTEPPNEPEGLSAAQSELISASVLEGILEPDPAFGVGNRVAMELSQPFASHVLQRWERSFEVYVATGSWERSWRYVGRVPDPGDFFHLVLGPDFEIDEEGLKVRVSKYVHLKNRRFAEDPAIEDLHRSWKLLDRSQHSAPHKIPKYRWHGPKAAVK